MALKKEIRILGIDDSPFNKYKDYEVLVTGTFFRGGEFIDGILSTKVDVDGSNSTDRLIDMINESKFKKQIHCVMLDGIAFGGFNIVDIEKLSEKTNIPVIVVVREFPDIDYIKSVLVKLGMDEKMKLIDKAGIPSKVNNIFMQCKGISFDEAREIISLSSTHSDIPEPIRVAHLIGAGVVNGESSGEA